jgi:multiple sugar transport system substrate-binding protein
MTPKRRWMAAGIAMVSVVLAACGGGSGGGGGTSGNQTIEFATQGLGGEGDASKKAVADFEKQNPNIHVNILPLSSKSDDAYQQLTQRFVSGSATPDVITADVIWPATFAKSGWIQPLDKFNPKKSDFFDGQIQGATYQGKLYGIPWFINAQGLYYRTDLVSQAPSSPQAIVTAAKEATQKDPAIKTGFAFAGDKYEGVVTTFLCIAGGFGGGLDLKHIDSSQNVQALTYMKNLIYQDQVTPQAATSWQEPNLEQAYMSGQAAFALNWPYVFQEAEASGSPVKGKTGWVPFPSSKSPKAALGGNDLVINAKSKHADAAYKFIQYMADPKTQITRALAAGDPPAVKSAYTDELFSKAPYFKEEQKVFDAVTPRPVTPDWPKVSDALQTELNAALTNQKTPQAALSSAQQNVNQIVGNG